MQDKTLHSQTEENIAMTNAGEFEEADFFRAEEWATPEMEL